jgi:hypothetical protein
VSGEAYVGGKITMENNVNNKKWFYMNLRLRDPLTASILRFGVSGTLRYQVHTSAQFHRFYCGSTLQWSWKSNPRYEGSINRLFIEGADNSINRA